MTQGAHLKTGGWSRLTRRCRRPCRPAAAALGDPHAARLAEELAITAGARFRDRFEGSAALPTRTGVERWAHPEAGELRLAYESLESMFRYAKLMLDAVDPATLEAGRRYGRLIARLTLTTPRTTRCAPPSARPQITGTASPAS